MTTLIHGKAFSIGMPVNKNGKGPASPEETVFTYYQVWDQVCNVICQCNDEGDAKLIAELLNERNENVTQ